MDDLAGQASVPNPTGTQAAAPSQSSANKATAASVNASTTVSTDAANTATTPTTGYAAQLASQQSGATSNQTPVDQPTADADPAGNVTSAPSSKQDSGTSTDSSATTAISSDPKTNPAIALAAAPTTAPQAAAQAQAATAPAAASMSAATVSAVIQQVTVHMSAATVNGVDHINVQLNPPELGHVEIRMEVGPSGTFNAVFAADRPQTVALLQHNAHELTRSLQDAGVRADAGSLSFNLRGQNQQQNSAFFNSSSARTPTPAWSDTPVENPVPVAAVYSNSNVGTGRVDIRV